MNYYNENELYTVEWLRNLIREKHIAPGIVDERSIMDVKPNDLKGFTQCHFFAGIGGWSLALRLAGWPDDRPIWTGSCPCQPFSAAGKGLGFLDERDLWPAWYWLISQRRPTVIFGEQVSRAIGKNWLDRMCTDLEGIDYACGAFVAPACAVNAPHGRDRLWFVADSDSSTCGQGDSINARGVDRINEKSRPGFSGDCRSIPIGTGLEGFDGNGNGRNQPGRVKSFTPGSTTATSRGSDVADSDKFIPYKESTKRSGQFCGTGSDSWASAEWLIGHDGKARRVKSGLPLLAHGIPGRVGKLRAYGNAIVPQLAAEMIAAYMECGLTNGR